MEDQHFPLCTTPLWDLNCTWYTEDPDFTSCFQSTILTWIPSVFFVLSLPYESYRLSHKIHNPISWNIKNISKLVFLLLLIAIQLVETITLLVNYDPTVFNYPITQREIAAIISTLTYILVLPIFLVHRKKGIHTSGTFFYFWLIKMVCEIIRYRSSINNVFKPVDSGPTLVLGTALAIAPLIIGLFFMELVPDNAPALKIRHPMESPENFASYFSTLWFWWIFGLTMTGSKKTLTDNDVPDLNKEYQSKTLGEELESYLDGNYSSLGRALTKQFGFRFLVVSWLFVIGSLLAFVTPLVMNLLIDFVSSDEPIWRGILYSSTLLIANIIRTFLDEFCVFRFTLYSLEIKSALTVVIYRKALKLSSSAKTKWTSGEVVNLVSVDCQRIFEGFMVTFSFVSGVVFLIVSIYLLFAYLGLATLAGVAVFIILIPGNTGLAKMVDIIQTELMKHKDKRVMTISEVLTGMKVLKLYAWEIPFEDEIIKLRAKEVHTLKKSLMVELVIINIFVLAPFMVSLFTYAVYIYGYDQILTPNVAFVSLSLFNLLRVPMTEIPFVVGELIKCFASFKRISSFVQCEELQKNCIERYGIPDDAVTVENGTFSWDAAGSASSCLSDINMKIGSGKLVGIVGVVGSGKSSLLSAILGDMHKSKGAISVQGQIAYVPQQAWIQNATVKDNIIFDSPFLAKKYDQIVKKCALEADFLMLSAGDQTEIGEKGINLSGGQKQRVSLARAVYNDADVYLFDDPLSAVDSHVGKHLFENVIGPGGILKQKTRLLVTHGLKYLPECDYVYMMKNGKIIESGTYDSLMESKKAFFDLMIQYDVTQEEEENKGFEDQTYFNMDEFEHRSIARSESIASSLHLHRSQLKAKKIKGRLIDDEGIEEGNISSRVYLNYFYNVGVLYFMLMILGFAGAIAFDLASNQWLSIWSSDDIAQKGVFNKLLNDYRIGIYALFGILQAITFFIGLLSFNVGAANATQRTHDLMLKRVMRAPMSLFDTTPMGRILNRFSRDVNTIDSTLIVETEKFFFFAWRVLGTIVIICINMPLFLIVAAIVIIIYAAIMANSIRSIRQLMRLESVYRSPVFSHIQESITGTSSIRAYNVVDIFIQRAFDKIDNNIKFYYSFFVVNSWLAVVLQIIGSFMVFFTALFAVLSRDTLDPAIVGLTVNYASNITLILYFLVKSAGIVESNVVSVERLLEYTKLPQEADWNIEQTKPHRSWPRGGAITLVDYQTRYREGLDLVLKGISIDIKPSEKVGIVGRTGAGKSSLTLALFRLIEASAGKILIDGVDISKIGLHNLRSKLTIIPQDPVLFSGSFRMNLDPINEYSDEELWNALEHAHLKTFAQNLETGLEFQIAEAGSNLSVGQRQLICLARALLRHTKILILDEATAAIDMETDDLIQQTIRKEFKDCTMFTIAHRLNTIIDSDRVIVLSDGQIIEEGVPSYLMANKQSAFYKMAVDAGLI